MAAQRVLVVYSSKSGSTAGIAGWIGEALRDEGLEADVAPADEVRDVTPYDAVVLGSALYFGLWRPDARRFARRHKRQLARVPVWLFSSGPLDTSAMEGQAATAPQAARIARRLGAEEHRTFGGRLAAGARGVIAGQMLGEDMGGDFRDREAVREWGRDIASRLRSGQELL